MIDWITHIWSKPLGTWTLLDVLGLLFGIPLAISAVIGAIGLICMLPAMAAEDLRRESAKRQAAKRKKLGYED